MGLLLAAILILGQQAPAPSKQDFGLADHSAINSDPVLAISGALNPQPEDCSWFMAHEVDGHCEITLTFTTAVKNLDCDVQDQVVRCDKPVPKKDGDR